MWRKQAEWSSAPCRAPGRVKRSESAAEDRLRPLRCLEHAFDASTRIAPLRPLARRSLLARSHCLAHRSAPSSRTRPAPHDHPRLAAPDARGLSSPWPACRSSTSASTLTPTRFCWASCCRSRRGSVRASGNGARRGRRTRRMTARIWTRWTIRTSRTRRQRRSMGWTWTRRTGGYDTSTKSSWSVGAPTASR